MHVAILSLNRTFYGIETREELKEGWNDISVLIVPFMELKPSLSCDL